jgi:bacteriorhodopsin
MLQELPTLTPGQYSLVYNMFSFTIATMAASFVFFVMARNNLAPKYRISMMISALVVFIAGYHYFRIFNSWEGAYALNEAAGMYEPTGEQFNDAYRYVDWLLTVPLLTVELVLVMGLPKDERGPMAAKLGFLAALMIVLGYPGEVSESVSFFGTRGLWGLLSTIPFIWILYILFTQLGDTIQRQSNRVATLLGNARLLLFATWGFYPIAYMIPMAYAGSYPAEAGGAVVSLQVGYTIADILAKAGYGVLIYNIAKAKSEEEGFNVDEMVEPAAATA